jgi:hypothetical protein
MVTYKVAELSVVTEDTIERAINQHVAQGWKLDGIKFAIGEGSRRPAMAFILFIKEDSDDHTEEG